MLEVSENSFLSYKKAFIEARDAIIKFYRLGREPYFEERNSEDIWQEYGYQDGFNYYATIIKTRVFDLEGAHTIDEIQDCFQKRIKLLNEEQERTENIRHSMI